MIEELPEGAGNVLGFRISGEVTDEDYTEVFIPALYEAIERYGTIRILIDIVDFKGEDFGAMLEDIRQDSKVLFIEREAIVGGEEWERRLTAVQPFFFLFPDTDVRFFRENQRRAAWDWIRERMRVR
ncbi:STAS/SEC14 domain-containing protein [Methanofollis formosanus]|nr:STAS/SEC14 domain-containing protein [Methanofollis formosanus]